MSKGLSSSAIRTACRFLGFFMLCILGISAILFYETSFKKREYRETGYTKDYAWNGLEVGTVLRYPVNIPIPIGRHFAVIVFKEGQRKDAHTLYEGAKSELPEKPLFLSGNEQRVTYRTQQGGDIHLDLSDWMSGSK